MKLSKTFFIFLIIVATCSSFFSFAYDDSHPPHKFKDGPFSGLDAEALVSLFGRREYKSEDGKVIVEFKDKEGDFNFLVQEGDYVLVKKQEWTPPYPDAVYRADIDRNGLKDFVIFYTHRGCGLGAFLMKTEIFLKKEEGKYQRIHYDAFYSDLGDFVDLDNDGKYEVITLDLHYGKKHNYWAYNIYKFENYKLVNADSEYVDFPKIVWFTYSPNDKDTTHLSIDERKEITREKNEMIKYGK